MKKFSQYLYEYAGTGEPPVEVMTPGEIKSLQKKFQQKRRGPKGRYSPKSKTNPNAPSPGCKKTKEGFFVCPKSRDSGGSPRSRRHDLRSSGLTPRKGYQNKSRAYKLNAMIHGWREIDPRDRGRPD
jgi:hypothetical protein